MELTRKILNSVFFRRLRRGLAVHTKMYLKFKRLSAGVSEELRTVKLLQHYNINKVLDVGANVGQFGESLLDFGYKGKIISFEPVPNAYYSLQKRARKYSQWELAERSAVGNMCGKIEINVSESTDFSSIKDIKSDFVSTESVAAVTQKELVDINTLDSLKGKYYNDSERIFLKIDTQGFEKEVIEGAPELLKKVIGIKLEIPVRSDLSIYEGVDWDLQHYINFFYEQGFKCVSIEPVSADKVTGIVNEVDGIFFKDL